MNQLFSITMEDYFEVVKRAKEAGIKEGESMEAIFLDYMKEKGQTSFARTELNKEELLTDLAQKHGNILDISVNSTGEPTYTIVKKNDEK